MPPLETPPDTVTVPPATRYRVSLICPTPLAHPELDVEADSPEAAWRQFCAANGITDSEHPRSIAPL